MEVLQGGPESAEAREQEARQPGEGLGVAGPGYVQHFDAFLNSSCNVTCLLNIN